MYQTIDDADDLDGEKTRSGGSLRWVLASMLVAFATLAMVTVLSLPSGPKPITNGTDDMDGQARAAYLAALSENSPALRRARLSDYSTTYTKSPRADAVRAQMSTLEAHEASDWANVTDARYDRSLGKAGKTAVLDAYESKWGPDLLGGRSDDIANLRDLFGAMEDQSLPSRLLDEEPSPIPNSIQAGTMAGGPVTQSEVEPTIVEPSIVESLPQHVLRNERVEIGPKILRAPTPRYPSSAQRRNVGGTVVVSMDIDERGRVDEVRVVSVDAERYGKEFARAARRAAKKTRFSPRTIDGRAVTTINVTKRYRFRP